MHQSNKQFVHYVSLVGFIFLFAVTSFFFLGPLLEVFDILANPDEGFTNYPFGTEQGYAYRSKETYFVTTLMWFFIDANALLISLLLYRLNQRLISLLVLAAPLLLAFYLAFKFN